MPDVIDRPRPDRPDRPNPGERRKAELQARGVTVHEVKIARDKTGNRQRAEVLDSDTGERLNPRDTIGVLLDRLATLEAAVEAQAARIAALEARPTGLSAALGGRR